MAKLIDLIVSGKSSFANDINAKNIYADKFATTGGTTAHVVRGDGTLQTIASLSVSHASTADSATNATNTDYLNVLSSTKPSTAYKDTKVAMYILSSTVSGSAGYAGDNTGFPVSNNANSIFWLGNHGGNYGGQLGISSNGNLYYRFISAGSFPTTANGGSWKTLLDSSNTSISDYNVKVNGTTKHFVRDWGHGATNMNAVARGGRSSMGMANLSNPSGGTASAVNPNSGVDWHHFINISYTDGGAGSNAWQTQIANKAGTTDLWVRSRDGGTISDTADWDAPWTRILTGSNYTNVLDGRYVNVTGDTMTGTLQMSTGAAIHLWDDSANTTHRLTLRSASDIGRIYTYTGSAYGATYIGYDGVNAIVVTSSQLVGIGTSDPVDKLGVLGNIRSIRGTKYMQMRQESDTWSSFYTNASKYYFDHSIEVNGSLWRYNTNYGIDSSGYFYAKGVYANRDGSNTGGGVSLYSNSDPMTYGIAFRGTGTYGTHGYVTAANDWATYLTMNDSTTRGWIFRRGSTNVFSIAGSGDAHANGIVNANRFISRVADGTQPYSCTSTTCNTNLNADLLDGYHAEVFLQRLRRSNLNISSSYSGMVPPDILSFKNGYPVYTDPEFASGNNSISVYNNSGGSAVTITRESSTTSGNSSGYCLHIKSAASGASPNGGGWYFATTGVQARVSVCVFRANIPTGYSVEWHSNSVGTGANNGWLTSTSGTGKYEWYAYMVEWGSSPSSSFFFTLNKAATVDWYLAYANVIDISRAAYDGLRTRYSDYATSAGNADTVDSLHASAFMRATSDGSFYGIQHPGGGTSDWTRTTSNGIIPYKSGGASNLGTSSWPFSTVYANNFYGYLNGNISGSSASVRDVGNGTAITFSYSTGGFTTNPTWLAAWNGYKVTYVSPSVVSVNYATSAGSASSASTATHLSHKDFNFTSGTTVAAYAKATTCSYNAGTFFSTSGWAWANSSNLDVGGYSVDRMRYSALVYRNGNLNSTWQQHAIMFIPTYSDSNMIYLAQMTTTDQTTVSTSVKRYLDYDSTYSNIYNALVNGYASSAGNADTVDSLHATAFMRATSDGSYYGIQHPGGGTSDWTRTTSNGIIPYKSGGASSLGTSSWPFSTVYANTFYGYLSGTASNATTATQLSSSAGSTTNPIYFTGGKPSACTYSLNATVSAGTASKIAYYSGANTIAAYTSSVGSSHWPMYLNAGVPSRCEYKNHGNVTWKNSSSGAIYCYQFGPVVNLQGYIKTIGSLADNAVVFTLPSSCPYPWEYAGITLAQKDGYSNDRNTVLFIKYGSRDCKVAPGYTDFNPNGQNYYFSICFFCGNSNY